jgi:hypothetical protein
MIVTRRLRRERREVCRQEGSDIVEQLGAAFISRRIRGHDDVVLRRQESSLLLDLDVAVFVDLEPTIHVEWAQTHRHAPALLLQRDVGEVRHFEPSLRRTMMNQ